MEEPQEEESRSLTIIIHSALDRCPVIHYYIGDSFERLPFIEYIPHFWCFQLEDITSEDDNFQICLSPTVGPSELIDLKFTQTQPFVFKDLTKSDGLIPFTQFHEFFSRSIASNFLTFSFDAEDPITSIRRFLSAFDDEYFVWALAFVSTQPWRALFMHNEEFSKMLLDFILPFIENNFFLEEDPEFVVNNPTDYFTIPVDIREIMPKESLHPTKKYESLGKYADVMMLMINEQLGDSLAYIFSTVIDFSQDFPFTAYVPPFYSTKCRYIKETEALITKLMGRFMCLDKEQMTVSMQRLLYTAIAIYNEHFTIKLKDIIDIVTPDVALIDLIVKLRMYESAKVCPEALKALHDQLPMSDKENDSEIASGDAIVPPEWLNCFFDIFKVSQEERNTIAEGSIKLSVPKHIADHFFTVTDSGALVMGGSTDAILQPGSILQPHTNIPETSMLMTGSVALDNSVLAENSYVPPDAILVSQEQQIDQSVLIETPVKIGRGTIIHKGSVICADANIGRGSIIYDDAIIGQGAVLGPGCTIAKGEVVPPRFNVPCGFAYSNDLIEYCTKIPNVITLRGTRFTKQASSFDIETLLSIENTDLDYLLKGYFEMMREFPREAGRQIALYAEKLQNTQRAAKHIVEIFENKVLSLSLSYWNTRTEECQEWDIIIKAACITAVAEFTIKIDEFEKNGTAEFLLEIAQNIDKFKEKGVEDELIEQMKKEMFSSCDELLVRLSLVSTAKSSKLCKCLEKITDITKSSSD